jgi:hypothetical protein
MPTITITPLPPQQGCAATICYDGTLPATLKLTWTPSGAGPDEVVIGVDGCADITIPGNAEALSITDPDGGAEEEATAILP